MRFKEVRYLINTDILRYSEENKRKISFFSRISTLLVPSVMALALHRIAHYFYLKKHPLLARVLWTVNCLFFSVDIVLNTSLGPYCYMPHPIGIIMMGKFGSRVTIFAGAIIGGGRGDEDIGAGKGSPVIGDDVMVGCRATILGPIRIGNNSVIGAGSLVLHDVPENTVTYGNASTSSSVYKPGKGASI